MFRNKLYTTKARQHGAASRQLWRGRSISKVHKKGLQQGERERQALWDTVEVQTPLLRTYSRASAAGELHLEVERVPVKTAILYIGPSMGFHLNLGQGTKYALHT